MEEIKMIDISGKEYTFRKAVAEGYIEIKLTTLELIAGGGIGKGDVLSTARVAAIMAVKETPRLIPLCHPLPISGVEVDLRLDYLKARVEIRVEVRLHGQTGAEMEALTGVSAAALTIYDMCKTVDQGMRIGGIALIEKSGGKSGAWKKGEDRGTYCGDLFESKER